MPLILLVPLAIIAVLCGVLISISFEHFRALKSNSHSSAIADNMTLTGHRIKWDHFDVLATGQSDIHCKIKPKPF